MNILAVYINRVDAELENQGQCSAQGIENILYTLKTIKAELKSINQNILGIFNRLEKI